MQSKLTRLLICVFLISSLLGGCAQQMGTRVPSVQSALPWGQALAEAAATVTAELRDNYAVYYDEVEYQMQLDSYIGVFGGIGIQMIEEDGQVIVYGLIKGGPSIDAGIQMGDVIVGVDGESVVGLSMDEVATRLRGDVGTEVTATLRRVESGAQYSVTIIRELIENTTAEGELLTGYPGIAYIHISSFSNNTPLEFYHVLSEMMLVEDVEAIIFDLRNNGGGSFPAALALAEFFVDEGLTLVWEKTYGGEEQHLSGDYDSGNYGALADLPVIILQNGYTASASEVFTGALTDYGVAVTVGTTSYGKGITQVIEALPNGGALQYTRSRYYTPLRFDLHGIGLEPDYLVENESLEVTYAEYFDPYHPANLHMRQALEILGAQLGFTYIEPQAEPAQAEEDAA